MHCPFPASALKVPVVQLVHVRSLVAVCAVAMYSPAKHVLIVPHRTGSPGLLEIVYLSAEHDPLVAHLQREPFNFTLMAVNSISSGSPHVRPHGAYVW